MDEFRTPEDMKRAENRLVEFFTNAIQIGLRASPAEVNFGHPVSNLIEQATKMSVRSLAKNLLDSYGQQGEYRLNGSGLKLYWHWYGGDGQNGRLGLTVSGDQSAYYEVTLPKLRELIRQNHWQPTP